MHYNFDDTTEVHMAINCWLNLAPVSVATSVNLYILAQHICGLQYQRGEINQPTNLNLFFLKEWILDFKQMLTKAGFSSRQPSIFTSERFHQL